MKTKPWWLAVALALAAAALYARMRREPHAPEAATPSPAMAAAAAPPTVRPPSEARSTVTDAPTSAPARTRRQILRERFGAGAAEYEARLTPEYLDEPVADLPSVEDDMRDRNVANMLINLDQTEDEYRASLERSHERNWEWLAPDYNASQYLNPKQLALDAEKLKLVADYDTQYIDEIRSYFSNEYFPALQAAKRRALDAGRVVATPFIGPADPNADARGRERLFGSATNTGSYAYSVRIYRGDDAELDLAHAHLQNLRARRGEQIALFIEQLR